MGIFDKAIGNLFNSVAGKELKDAGVGVDTALTMIKDRDFQKFLLQINTVWKENISKDEKWVKTSALIDGINDTTYDTCFMHIMAVIQRSPDKCAAFDDTKAQVDFLVEKLPRLSDRRELVELVISERRKNYGLKV